MKRVAVMAALFAAGTVYGAVVSVGGFYALSIPAGGEEFEDSEPGTSIFGFGGKFSVGDMSGLNFDYAFGYNAKFELEPHMGWEFHYTSIPITSGVSYKFDLDPIRPYAGIGGAYVIMGAHEKSAWEGDYNDRFCFPGAYVGGGIIYAFTDVIAVDVNPRYVAAFDPGDGDLSFGFFDVLVGVDFYL